MFSDVLRWLHGPQPDPLDDDDARLALAALLVRIARADHDYRSSEQRVIEDVLQRRFGLSARAAKNLRAEAEELEAAAPDTVRFTRAIKDAVAYEDRLSVIECLWEVVLADGVRDHEENALLRLAANLLGVNDRDSNLARKKVEARS